GLLPHLDFMILGAGQVGQGFGQTGAFRSHLSRPALAETEGVKGVRQAGIRLNRLTRIGARLSHPYHGF
ncbi:MAG: hypothetical protein KJ063_21715, partial [Anaerolineae bacterium]|nr:hypothetical protein [Anaerolineae bacterium]